VPPLGYEPSPEGGPLRQAEVLRDVIEVRAVELTDGNVGFVRREHPLSVVMTQDCDLEQDYFLRYPGSDSAPGPNEVDTAPNALRVVLLCDAYDAGDIEPYLPAKFNRKERELILGNRNERYHCLEESASSIDPPLPPILLDLRTPFGVTATLLYAELEEGIARRAAIVPPIFMHDLMHRFYGYHARVALPPAQDQVADADGTAP
jgi:hypothetical protein